MYTLPEADSAGGACTRILSRHSYTCGTHGHITARARVRTYVYTVADDSHGGPCALCCARGHDNSAEKPRNICPTAINSETAPTFLANLHKTVTYHSIIRPIRPPRRPFIRLPLPPPGHRALPLPPFPDPPFSPPHSTPPGGSDRVLSAVFSALCTFRNSLQIRSMSPACEGGSGPFAIVLRDTAQPIALSPTSGQTIIHPICARSTFISLSSSHPRLSLSFFFLFLRMS